MRKRNKLFHVVVCLAALMAVSFAFNDFCVNGFARVLNPGTRATICGQTVIIPHKSFAVLRRYYISPIEGNQWPLYKSDLKLFDNAKNQPGTMIYLNEYFYESELEKEKSRVEMSSNERIHLNHFFAKNEQAYVSYAKDETILNVFIKSNTKCARLQVWVPVNHASSKQIEAEVIRQLGK